MTNTPAHENIIVGVHGYFADAMRVEQTHNTLLRDLLWTIYVNRSTWYKEGGSDQFTADMTIFYDNSTLFFVEVAFSQRWGLLKIKIDRMLADEETWGVLVVKITEKSRWSEPKRAPKKKDFVSSDAWKNQALIAQAVDEYGGITVNGLKWTEEVTCSIVFFPADWRLEDGDPPSVSCPITPFSTMLFSNGA
jgi:hypothetical protein